MNWWDDHYYGSSDYPRSGQDAPADTYPDPWAAAEALLDGEPSVRRVNLKGSS